MPGTMRSASVIDRTPSEERSLPVMTLIVADDRLSIVGVSEVDCSSGGGFSRGGSSAAGRACGPAGSCVGGKACRAISRASSTMIDSVLRMFRTGVQPQRRVVLFLLVGG